ncbi:DMT family transporter [Catenovulum agarivorans]|uniref:DMT family transporter n=1 Tax=Catenovulum agarivorans TaxID=1172192 RepID=UPI0002D86862|nr:DMT family transporter [Catenovulum agarivorans]
MLQNNSLTNSGFSLAFIAVAMFSSKSIFIKLAYEYGVDTTTLMTWRMLLAMPFYLYMLHLVLKQPMRQPLSRDSIISIIVLGLMGYYAASWLDLYALNFITAHYERIVLYTYPAFVLIINALWQKRPIKLVELASLTIAYAGLLLIFYYDLSNLGEAVITGTLLVLASSLSFSFYVVGSQKYSGKYGSKFFTCIAMLAATVAIVIHFFLTHNPSDLLQPLPVLLYAAAIAIIATVIPSFLMNAAIEKIGANNASISGSLGPVLTTIFAIILLDEVFTLVHALGMALVIAGIYYLSKKHKS